MLATSLNYEKLKSAMPHIVARLAILFSLFIAYFIIVAHWGGLVFSSARLNGLVQLFVFLIPWECLILMVLFGRWWLKIGSLAAIWLLSLACYLWWVTAIYCIRYNQDPFDDLVARTRVGGSYLCLYSHHGTPFDTDGNFLRWETPISSLAIWTQPAQRREAQAAGLPDPDKLRLPARPKPRLTDWSPPQMRFPDAPK